MSETALLVAVPQAEPIVGTWRARHDPSAALGVPAHITVMYPFLPSERLDEAVLERLRQLFAGEAPFRFRLDTPMTFPGSRALYLPPVPSKAFTRLTDLVREMFGTMPYGGVHPDVIPHLTIVDGAGDDVLASASSAVGSGLPIKTYASTVWLMASGPDGRWDLRERFPLIGGWVSLRPEDLPELLGDGFDWRVAGGWAIDLLAGAETRPHNDVDVEVARTDQRAVHDRLAGWELWCADPPGTLRPWRTGEDLPKGVNDVFCRPSATSPWAMQLMLVDDVDGEWVFRHEPRVRRPRREATWLTSSGIAVVAAELQLLFKSRHRYDKDEHDFAIAIEFMSGEQRAWLDQALAVLQPQHPWRTRLGADEGNR